MQMRHTAPPKEPMVQGFAIATSYGSQAGNINKYSRQGVILGKVVGSV